MKIPIESLASIGLIQDVKPYLLPPEAWTSALNMRFSASGVERIGGRRQVFGTPNVAPHFVSPFQSAPDIWWLYGNLTSVHAYDGTTHYDITGTTTPAALVANDWCLTNIGGIPVMTDGATIPQYWPAYNGATNLADVPAWPAATYCNVIKAFGPYLLAMNVSKPGGEYPHMVKWSHPADPGAMPASWDETDETMDAGENQLSDAEAGPIVDGASLRGNFYIYKQGSTWIVRAIGGRDVFKFDPFLETSGILTSHCVAQLVSAGAKWHFVATQDNCLIHDGSNVIPLLDKRMKSTIFNQIDTTNFTNSFVFPNPARSEIWFCWPESGNEFPTRALIWNYGEGSERGSLSEAEVDYRGAAAGDLDNSGSDLAWDDETALGWDSGGSDIWNVTSRRQVVVANTGATKLQQLDNNVDIDGVTFSATLTREDLGLVGRSRIDNTPIVDFSVHKLVNRVWIKAEGGPFNVRLGSSTMPDASIAWSASTPFDPSTEQWVDIVTEGAAISIEFSSTAAVAWKILGYKLDLVTLGEY